MFNRRKDFGSVVFSAWCFIVFWVTNLISLLFNLWAMDWHDVVRNIVLYVISSIIYYAGILIHWSLGVFGIGILFVVLRYAV